MKTLDIMIGIPARYGSTRFPGKPLAMIGGKTMIAHVIDRAREAIEALSVISYLDLSLFVTTDDERIAKHVEQDLGEEVVITAKDCKTGSDRLLAALRQFDNWPDFLVNLQGDAPFTPSAVIEAIINAYIDDPDLEVITPVYKLTWQQLDALRKHKETTPFSGTTAILNDEGKAFWFSKNVIPAIREEQALREQKMSPVYQHIGLYGYQPHVLEKFCGWEQSKYERVEGLEQLRFLENGVKIHTVRVSVDEAMIQSGIDTPEDLKRAERLLNR